MAFMQQLADKKGVTIAQVIRDGVHLLLVNNGLRPEHGDQEEVRDIEHFIKTEKKRIIEPNFMKSEPGELSY